MKLSDAIVLGQGLIKFDPSIYLSVEEKCGCLLGAGYVAVRGFKRSSIFVHDLANVWPWTREMFQSPFHENYNQTGEQVVSEFANRIHSNQATFEQALEWIRQNEPVETVQVQSQSQIQEQSIEQLM